MSRFRVCVQPEEIYIQLTLLIAKLQYRDTLARLVDETQSCLGSHISILWALAQRASVDAKVNACIECVLNSIMNRILSHLFFHTEWDGEVRLRVKFLIKDPVLNALLVEYWSGPVDGSPEANA